MEDRMSHKILVALLVVILLAACGQKSNEPHKVLSPYPDPSAPGDATVSSDNPGAGNPYPSPLDAISGEENMKRGEVFLDKIELYTLESYPVQVMLHVTGDLPTPCYRLRAKMTGPDDQNQIQIDLFSLVKPEDVCTQMLQPFDVSFSLGSFKDGKYTVWLNGKQVGEFGNP
jgi:inhibitor of cysteine peptidase